MNLLINDLKMGFFDFNTTFAVNKIKEVTFDIDRKFFENSFYASGIYSLIGVALLVILLWWLFYVPYEWVKHLDDVSYDVPLKKQKVNSSRKKDAINRIRRLRQMGNCTELPPPYPNGWYGILESDNLKMGEAINVSCLGESFVVYRTMKNEVFALDAYCPHMGANMGIGGKVIGDNIECPFHQWQFRGADGKCAHIPYSSGPLESSKVRKWITKEVNDNIFLWYHAEIDEEPWELPVVEAIESQELVYHGRNEFYVNCHIQEIPENGADLAHFTAIHNVSLLAGGGDPSKSLMANFGNHKWQAVWNASKKPLQHLANVTLKHSIEFSPKLHMFHMDVVGQQIGPSYVQLHMVSPTFGRIEVLQTITPIEPMLQKVVHRFYASRFLGPIMKFVVFGESIMFERDVNVWNHKVFRGKPQLVKEEAVIKSFRNWYSQFYTENSKPFTEANSDLSW